MNNKKQEKRNLFGRKSEETIKWGEKKKEKKSVNLKMLIMWLVVGYFN